MNCSLRCALVLLSLVVASHAQADAAKPAEPTQSAEEETHPAPLRISGAITDAPPVEERRLIPPFGRDRRGDFTTTALFPFYFSRTGPDRVERFVLPYYYRRSPTLDADVAAGLVWSLRGPDRNTFVLPPFYTHRRGKSWGVGLLPLFTTGVFGKHYHTVLPPLLTWIDGDDETHRWLAGPYYDVKTKRARWRGLFPLLWSKSDGEDGFQVVPPLFWRFTNEDPASATTVVPPFYHTRRKDERTWGLIPLLFHKRTPELRATTVPLAIFHHARGPKEFRLVTPVLAYLDDPRDGKFWITPIYQRRRGDKNFDAVLPLFARTWDTRDQSSALYLPPIFWHRQDPANRTTVVFPVFAHDHREGISDFLLLPFLGRKKSYERDEQTWWVAPTFHWAWTPDTFQFNIHPVFYRKRTPERSHLALAPLYWDFRDKKKQTHRFTIFPLYWDFANKPEQKKARVVFPLYWDIERGKRGRRSVVAFPLYWDFDDRDRDARYTVAFPFYARSVVGERTRHFSLNTMTERSSGKDKRWQFHFFPLLSLGGSERGKWWSVLYGLAGYDRRGGHRRAQAFWIPFDLGQ